jgi:iron(II)-dependent oxidoreductase
MALIPRGTVSIVECTGTLAQATIEAFYLDRCAVTNREYRRFIEAGGYDDLEFWPRAVWPSLMKFVDRDGRPGPRGWNGGSFPASEADHPVVGVCWHEASAYARWVGKRLPTAAEWQKAAGWPEDLAGGFGNRYPWGDIFAPDRANLAATRIGRTVPVREFARGATVNGIYQLCGNVWEWLDDPLDAIPAGPDETFVPWQPMRRIAGGAFDTYLPAEATCHFITGQPELDRRHNIGFRCAVSCDRLRPSP